jgi:hypothetical protein
MANAERIEKMGDSGPPDRRQEKVNEKLIRALLGYWQNNPHAVATEEIELKVRHICPNGDDWYTSILEQALSRYHEKETK